MEPTIGRIVHLVADEWVRGKLAGNHHPGDSFADAPVAAVIVRVWSNTCVNLKAFGDSNEDVWVTSVIFDNAEKPAPRTWHWPAKV